MATLPLGDIDLYWERRGEGPRLLFVNGSGATIESAAPLIDAFARQFEVVVHDQRGLGRTTVPERQPTMADFASDAAALARPRRLGHGERVRHQLRRDGGPGAGGHVARAHRSPRAVLHLARRRGRVVVPAGGAGRAAARRADRRRGRATSTCASTTRGSPTIRATGPSSKSSGRACPHRRPTSSSGASGCRSSPDRATTCGRGWSASRPPRSSPAVRTTGSRRGRTARPSPAASPTPELRCYEGGHLFVYQDPQAMPDITEFLRTSSSTA